MAVKWVYHDRRLQRFNTITLDCPRKDRMPLSCALFTGGREEDQKTSGKVEVLRIEHAGIYHRKFEGSQERHQFR
jgi:hypothetical protein